MCETHITLSVIVAAYNEETVISQSIRRIIEELSTRDINWEIVCVNDGSTDRTGELLDEIAETDSRIRIIHQRRNFGQGKAIRAAFDVCMGEIFITLDADLSYGPEYIYLLSHAIIENNVEIALASPYIKGGTVRNVPFYRYFLSRIGNYYLASMSQYSISTSTCVVRAYRREVIDKLLLTSDGMELQLEILSKSYRMGFRICEVPANLKWSEEKNSGKNPRRISKMKIARSIRLYLLMGWLSRPAPILCFFSLMLILPGSYMAVALLGVWVHVVMDHLNEGLIFAISKGLNHLYDPYTYTVVISSSLLLIGIQILAFSLLLLQNQLYFEELRKMMQIGLKNQKYNKSHLPKD